MWCAGSMVAVRASSSRTADSSGRPHGRQAHPGLPDEDPPQVGAFRRVHGQSARLAQFRGRVVKAQVLAPVQGPPQGVQSRAARVAAAHEVVRQGPEPER